MTQTPASAPRALVTVPPIPSVPIRISLRADCEPAIQPSNSVAAIMPPTIRARRVDEFMVRMIVEMGGGPLDSGELTRHRVVPRNAEIAGCSVQHYPGRPARNEKIDFERTLA
jgi:hypothetical protein